MKKNIFIAVLGLGLSAVGSAYGQGQIFFNNYYSPTQTTGVFYLSGPAAGQYVGPEISAILLYSSDTTVTSVTQMTQLAISTVPFGLGAVSAPGALGTGAGWFDAGTIVVPGTPGSTYAFAIEATGLFNGVTYTGFSPIATGTTSADSTATVPTLPTLVLHSNFSVAPIPEPSTLALAGLGGFGMLMALRRKKA